MSIVKPGDTLIVAIPGSQLRIDAIAAQLSDLLPGVVVRAVNSGSGATTVLVHYTPQETP